MSSKSPNRHARIAVCSGEVDVVRDSSKSPRRRRRRGRKSPRNRSKQVEKPVPYEMSETERKEVESAMDMESALQDDGTAPNNAATMTLKQQYENQRIGAVHNSKRSPAMVTVSESTKVDSIEQNNSKAWQVADELVLELYEATSCMNDQTSVIESLKHNIRQLKLEHIVDKYINRGKQHAFLLLKHNRNNEAECLLVEEVVRMGEKLNAHQREAEELQKSEARFVCKLQDLRKEMNEILETEMGSISTLQKNKDALQAQVHELLVARDELATERNELRKSLKFKTQSAQSLCSKLMKLEFAHQKLQEERDDLVAVVDTLREVGAGNQSRFELQLGPELIPGHNLTSESLNGDEESSIPPPPELLTLDVISPSQSGSFVRNRQAFDDGIDLIAHPRTMKGSKGDPIR